MDVMNLDIGSSGLWNRFAGGLWEDLAFYPKGKNVLEYLKKQLKYHSALVAAQEANIDKQRPSS